MKLSKKIFLSFTLYLFISPVFADQESFQETKIRATQGDARAQYNLGWMYDNGQGVTQSDSKAFEWYSKAAAQGNAKAQYNLGWMYGNGQGVEKNYS
ncbi:MAG: sel1 repeat family protein, partial [Paludibacteraceae bacterium]|nr:sel1 repeat family protein [Paludibacteraceae bacterium]